MNDPLNPLYKPLDALDQRCAILQNQVEAALLNLADLLAAVVSFRAALVETFVPLVVDALNAQAETQRLTEQVAKEVALAQSPLETPPGGDLPAPGDPETAPEPGDQPPSRVRRAARRHPVPQEQPPVA